MAKALFHKNQRVFVKPVGTTALVEKVLPQWVKGLDEPFRITYDVGFGREFEETELEPEQADPELALSDAGDHWRVVRAPNGWKEADECGHHPQPGSVPVVITGETEWGGWRVPGAEYDLYPDKIEMQARILSSSLDLLNVTRELVTLCEMNDQDIPAFLKPLVKRGRLVLKKVVHDK